MRLSLPWLNVCMIALRGGLVAFATSGPQTAPPVVSPPAITKYTLDEIPAQIFSRGTPVIFDIDALGTAPQFALISVPQPRGPVSIDSSAGHFSFTPSPDDIGNFQFTITAHNAEGSLSKKQFVVSLFKNLPPEYQLVSTARAIPPPDDSRYLTVTETLDPSPRDFNNVTNRKVMNVSVSGKTIVFEDGSETSNLFARFNSRSDIATLNLYGETVIIRSRLLLPETSVHIFAKELRFEDNEAAQPASIETTPLSVTTKPDAGNSGSDGLAGGDLVLNIQFFHSDPGPTKRFILDGGNGQDAGAGIPGDNGNDVPCERPPVNDTCVVHVHYYAGPTIFGTDGLFEWPGDGQPPKMKPGTPGSPGSGGNFIPNVPGHESFVSNEPGRAGNRADDLAATNPGHPLHAQSFEIKGVAGHIESTHDSKGSPAVAAPGPKVLLGAKGKMGDGASGVPWLQPFALRAILDHANDAYLNGNLEYTTDIVSAYQSEVSKALNEWDASTAARDTKNQQRLAAAPVTDRAQILREIDENNKQHELLVNLSLEMAATAARLNNNLDYFGNPAGWVPQLSLGASLSSFSKEIDSDIPILYLAYYVQQLSNDADHRIAGLQDSRNKLSDDLSHLSTQLNETEGNIPALTVAAGDLQNKIVLFQAEVTNKERDLVEQAQTNVDARHSVPFWKQALGTLSAVASVCPVGQPVLGSIGVGLGIIDKIGTDTPLDTIKQASNLAGDFTQAKLKESVQQYHEEVSHLDPSNAPNATAYVKSLIPVAQKLADGYKTVNDSVKTHQASSDEVNAELAQLEASDAQFTKLSDDLRNLNVQKQMFTSQLADATNEASQFASSMQSDWQSIDAINQAMSSETAQDDHDVVQEIKSFGNRARDRLLKYQYYMAKAYEYRMLKPYDGDFTLNQLVDKIQELISRDQGSTYKSMSTSDDKFKALESAYVDSIREVVKNATNQAQANPLTLTAPYQYSLSKKERDQLNSSGAVTLDLSLLVPHFDREENRRINGISARISTSGTQENPMLVTFDHWGTSTFRFNQHSFTFDHRRSSSDRPFEWGGIYDKTATTTWTEESVSPDYLDFVKSLIDPSLSGLALNDLFVTPGLDATLTVQRQRGGNSLKITDLKLIINYGFDRSATLEYALDVTTQDGDQPLINVSPEDNSHRTLGQPHFTRMYAPGAKVTLTAPSQYGDKKFVAWHVGSRNVRTPTLDVSMDKSQVVSLEYH